MVFCIKNNADNLFFPSLGGNDVWLSLDPLGQD